MTRNCLLAAAALPLALMAATGARAQDLQDRKTPPPPPSETALPADADQVQFSAGSLQYDSEADMVSATGDVRMYRGGDRLRADRLEWNRKTGQVIANGNIAVTNPTGDTAYGDRIELTDSLKDGVIENMLIVLNEGGRLAAQHGVRGQDGTVTLDHAAYTPCDVTKDTGCPKEPTWKITAVRILYDPVKERIRYSGAQFDIFGLSIPLPAFSHPIGKESASGLLTPDLAYSGSNGLSVSVPYYVSVSPGRGLTLTPTLFTNSLPMLEADYRSLWGQGAFEVNAYGTYSRRSDDILAGVPSVTLSSKQAFRGYLDGVGRFQLDPYWSVSGSTRLTTDRTFLRRYSISNDDRLRNTVSVQRIDQDSYFSATSWIVQTLRLTEDQGLQPIALPVIDYRKRLKDTLFGGSVLQLEANTLGITRTEGQDTQRAFVSAEWDLRKLTRFGQEVTFTAYARGDAYNANDVLATTVAAYRGLEGFHTRAIGALAMDVKWPFIGEALGGTQRFTPRVQLVLTPSTANLEVPNEDARAVDLEDSNLFALNRFPGYDRWEDSPRVTYGAEWALDRPGLTIDAVVGQSYRLAARPTLFPSGTGLDGRFSDIVGRTVVRFKDIVSVTHRYRIDKNDLAVRRNEIDATIGSRSTYILLGYLRLNRNITSTLEDLQDREEARIGARVQIGRHWSMFGSTVIDLTDKSEDVLSLSDGFDPVRHRVGVTYEDDCLRLGVTWKRDYQATGDARAGNSYLLTLAFKNLGR